MTAKLLPKPYAPRRQYCFAGAKGRNVPAHGEPIRQPFWRAVYYSMASRPLAPEPLSTEAAWGDLDDVIDSIAKLAKSEESPARFYPGSVGAAGFRLGRRRGARSGRETQMAIFNCNASLIRPSRGRAMT